MAKIPDIRYAQGQLAVQRSVGPGPESAGQMGRAIAGAALTYADEIRKSQQREGETKAAQEFTQLQLEMNEKFVEMKEESLTDPEGFTERYLSEARSLYDKRLQASDNEFYKITMSSRFDSILPRVQQGAIGFEGSQKVAVQKERLSQSVDNLSALVGQNPSFLPQALSQLEGDFAGAVANGIVPEDSGLQSSAKKQILSSVVDSYMNSDNAYAAEKFLEDNAQAFGKDYVRYKARVVSGIEAEEAKRSKQILSNIQELAIQGRLQDSDGNPLGEQFYDTYLRDQLEPQDRPAVLGLIRSGMTTTSDGATYIELSRRARRGEDITDEIYGAAATGQLTQQDMNQLLDDVQSNTVDGVKNPVSVGRASVTGFFASDYFRQNPNAGILRQLAINDYEEWANSLESEPTTQQALDKSNEIASRFIPEQYKASLNKVGAQLKVDEEKAKKIALEKAKNKYMFENPSASEAQMLKDPRFKKLLAEERKTILGIEDALGN